jgi:hypothetical protein
MRRTLIAGWRNANVDASARQVVRELDDFLHSEACEVIVIAELAGLQLPSEQKNPIVFEDSPRVELTPLTDDMIHSFDLEASSRRWDPPRLTGACAITVRSMAPIRFGAPDGDNLHSDVDRVGHAQDLLLALQVTQRGAVGAPRTIQSPTSFVPITGLRWVSNGEAPRWDVGMLALESIDRIRSIYRSLRNSPHPSMRLACSRLGLSRLRLRPDDAILDAAIGLEAILLGSGGKAELRYQFSLNYALLEPDSKKRVTRFHLAQSIYDVRSAIAHGGHPNPKDLKKIDVRASSMAAAEVCQNMLEECIEAFRADMVDPEFTQAEYWKRRALGLSAESRWEGPGASSDG